MEMNIDSLSLPFLMGLFVLAAFVIVIFGSRMTRLADRLADVTGLGEAIMGAVFLGASTSLPGIITSVTAAWHGYAEMAVSNAVGGIAVQTAFLALADITYRRANLEHAAASVPNMMQGMLLAALLTLALMGALGPNISIFGIHIISFILPLAYILGLRETSETRDTPMWKPLKTGLTLMDEPESEKPGKKGLVLYWVRFVLIALVVALAGYVVARSGMALSERAGISQTIVGGLMTAIATSLPELITALAAVRQRALTLAVGGIIGGNSFDVLFLAFSDYAYREGPIYGAMGSGQLMMITVTLLMTTVLALGMLRRERHGIGNIGFESFIILILYGIMVVLMSLG
jgi:cation:H+ antiporter